MYQINGLGRRTVSEKFSATALLHEVDRPTTIGYPPWPFLVAICTTTFPESQGKAVSHVAYMIKFELVSVQGARLEEWAETKDKH